MNRDKLMNPSQEIKNWLGVLFPPKLEDDVEIGIFSFLMVYLHSLCQYWHKWSLLPIVLHLQFYHQIGQEM